MSDSARPPRSAPPHPRPVDSELFRLARDARERAHAPYSGFAVGAAVRGESGRIFAGCNVENSAYPQGWCAETSAIAAMVVGGDRRIREVAVVGGSGAGDEPLCTPCGGCRQKLREFAAPDVLIHVCDPLGPRRTVTLGELLPLDFGPRNLGAPTRDRE